MLFIQDRKKIKVSERFWPLDAGRPNEINPHNDKLNENREGRVYTLIGESLWD